jgi:hypothetical protein
VAPDAAAGLRSGRLETGMAAIAAPRPGAVVQGPSVRVRVRAAPGASLRAWLDRREVTRAFRREGGDRVAVLRPPLGVNHLYVRARDGRGRRDFDSVRFLRVRRTSGLLTASARPRRAPRGGLAVHVGLARGTDRVRGRLNGHRLGAALGSGRRRALVLDADDGLRFGRNRLVLSALDEAGRVDFERRLVRLRRSRPIPGAGPARRARVRRALRLDATRSRAARRRSRLSYRWTIVRAPKGSRARLRAPRSARPHLRPDRRGTYRVRLEVVEHRPAPASAAPPRSTDTVSVRAVPDAPPLGVPIDTVFFGGSAPSGVHLGAPINETIAPQDPTLPLQLVLLDRTTLELQQNTSYTGDEPGTAQLLSDVKAAGRGSLAIIVNPDSTTGLPIDNDQTALDSLNDAMEAIGSFDLDQRLATNPFCDNGGCSNFSAIGVPGLSAQQGGTQNPGLKLAPNGDTFASRRGDLRGYLQLDSSGNYTYVNTDWVPFTTQGASASATQGAITVGSDAYTSLPIAPGQSAFFVLILDAGTLTYRNAGTFLVNGADPLRTANDLASMEAMLATAAGDGSQLVFIQTIGSVDRPDSSTDNIASTWTQIAVDQGLLGGHAYLFNTIDGSQGANQGTYAFVGPGEPPSPMSPTALTASPQATGTPGRLSGWLARNSRSQFSPRAAGPTLGLDVGLPGVVYRRPVAWPDRDTPGHLAAIACVASAVNPSLPTPVEDNYTNKNLDLEWSTYASAVESMSYDKLTAGPCPNPSFSAQDFADVQSQLYDEWTDLATVTQFITNLKTPLQYNNTSVQGHVSDVTQDVQNAVPGVGGQAWVSSEQLIIDTFWIASYIPGAGDVFGIAAAALQLSLDTANGQNGSPSVGALQAAVDELPDKLGAAYASAYGEIDQLGDLIKSDWGKLSITADRAVNQWAWTNTSTFQAADAFDASMTKLAYESLVPTAFQYYRFGDQVVSNAGDYQCALITPLSKEPAKFNPFAGEWNGGQTNITGAGPTTDLVALGLSDTTFLSSGLQNTTQNGAAPVSLMQDMFTNATPTTFGTVQNETPLPSPLRFEVETYDNVHVITHPDPGYCLVDGKNP